MLRARHENVATVLVDPPVLAELEVHLMALDLHVWPVETAPICRRRPAPVVPDPAPDDQRPSWRVGRRRRVGAGVDLVRGRWRDRAEPISWAARSTLYAALDRYGDRVRYRRGLGGVPPLAVPRERSA